MKTKHSGNRGHGRRALTWIDVIVILAVWIIAVLVVIPMVTKPRRRSSKLNCANNLKQISLSFKLWAGDNNDRNPMQVPKAQGGTLEFVPTGLVFPHFQVMSNELATPKLLHCYSDGARACATNFTSLTDTQISYFVGVDTSNDSVSAWLSGDRNLTTNGSPIARGLVAITTNMLVGWQTNIHNKAGNVLLADGSVQQPSSMKLPALFMQSPFPTNRFAVP
jgi:prepilin-type processing-associated H-X9-DG protein